ncbi:hypothetical protein [Streptomyces sp. NPDC053726]|uniref:hypothetical protein n=1 Tax=Streptomyces sp. NPDC053726 TaxID=3365713 RepID=UPI0037D2481A
MQLTIAVQNLGHGGLKDGDGNPEDRWPLLAERINAAADRVDVVMVSEAVDWHSYGHKQLARAIRDLDMDAVALAQTLTSAPRRPAPHVDPHPVPRLPLRPHSAGYVSTRDGDRLRSWR